ncbi:hypothetical protein M0R45_027987 [Rubus argutus]|uniref:(S)-ureidoglycine aminohydrolase cupin domain-containing protein n=1 Tax=Rubus argutus TaxID=59490 RepID=A0AAW1W6E3_RUBAR
MTTTSDSTFPNLGIAVESNPLDSCLSELGINSWPEWGCAPGKYTLKFEAEETCYLDQDRVLEGAGGAEVGGWGFRPSVLKYGLSKSCSSGLLWSAYRTQIVSATEPTWVAADLAKLFNLAQLVED